MKKFFKVLRTLLLIIITVLVILIMLKIINRFDRYTTRYGVVDFDGNVLIDFKYYDISTGEQDKVKPNYFKYVYADFWGRKKTEGYLDTEGKVCFEKVYGSDKFIPKFNYNKAAIVDNTINKEGYIDIHENRIRDFKHDHVGDFKGGYAWVYDVNEKGKGKYGLIDYEERLILPVLYDDEIKVLSDYCFLVFRNNELYIVDRDNKKIADCTYEYKDDNGHPYKKVNEITFIDLTDLSNMGPIKSSEEDEYIFFIDNNIFVYKDGRTKIFNKNGNLVNDIDGFIKTPTRKGGNFFIREKDDKKYILDKYEDFKEIYESKDNKVIWDVLNDNSIIVYDKELKKFGVIDFQDNIKIPFEYDELTNDLGFLLATKGNQKGLLDSDGNEIVFNDYTSYIVAGDYIITTNRVDSLVTVFRTILGICAAYLVLMLIVLIKSLKKIKITKKSYR